MRNEETGSITINDSNSLIVVWTPTCNLRWRKIPRLVTIGKHRKILEQLWQGSNGEQEWKELPTITDPS